METDAVDDRAQQAETDAADYRAEQTTSNYDRTVHQRAAAATATKFKFRKFN